MVVDNHPQLDPVWVMYPTRTWLTNSKWLLITILSWTLCESCNQPAAWWRFRTMKEMYTLMNESACTFENLSKKRNKCIYFWRKNLLEIKKKFTSPPKNRQNSLTTKESDSAVCEHRWVSPCSVQDTSESDSTECITPRSLTLQCSRTPRGQSTHRRIRILESLPHGCPNKENQIKILWGINN